MIGWLLDLIFSNFWLLLILFWVFRSLGKGFKQGMEGKSPRPQQPVPSQPYPPASYPPRPYDVEWEWDVESEPVAKNPKKAPLIESEPQVSVPISPITEQPKADATSIGRPAKSEEILPKAVHPAVQGMMWSQVFGPPRARAPHRSSRRKM